MTNFSSVKTGLLLAQIGTPAAPTPAALRTYLKEFLSDPRIAGGRKLWWQLLLRLVILNTRPKHSAKMYQQIWTTQGSPLLKISLEQVAGLRQALEGPVEIELGLTCGSPSIRSAIESLQARHCSRLVLFPLFPQYSSAATGSACDLTFDYLKTLTFIPALQVIEPFYAHQGYLQALAELASSSFKALAEPPDYLVLSYHGLPITRIAQGDPYAAMCEATSKALLPLLEIDSSRVIHSYQSRFGRGRWLEPNTLTIIEDLAHKGVKNLAVACPGFTADCLETLYEIGIEAKQHFLARGGKNFTLIPCLNSHPRWIETMRTIVLENLKK